MHPSKSSLRQRKTWTGGVLLSPAAKPGKRRLHPPSPAVLRGWEGLGQHREQAGLGKAPAMNHLCHKVPKPSSAPTSYLSSSLGSGIWQQLDSCLWSTRIPTGQREELQLIQGHPEQAATSEKCKLQFAISFPTYGGVPSLEL